MAALTVYATNDGFCYRSHANYANAQASATGYFDGSADIAYVGQSVPGATYGVRRGVLFFDTSDLPAGCTITSAVLSLYGSDDLSTDDFDIVVVSGADLTPPLDFSGTHYGDLLDEITSMGSMNSAGWSTAGYNDITLNVVGRAAISRTGLTKLALRASTDISATQPSNSEQVEWWTSRETETGERRPKLVINYVLTGAAPGFVWQDETELHIIDQNVAEQSFEGDFISHFVSPQPLPHLWMQTSTTFFLRYIDIANVDKRKIEGTPTGVTGQPKGTLFIEGANIHGIDENGAEQYA